MQVQLVVRLVYLVKMHYTNTNTDNDAEEKKIAEQEKEKKGTFSS